MIEQQIIEQIKIALAKSIPNDALTAIVNSYNNGKSNCTPQDVLDLLVKHNE